MKTAVDQLIEKMSLEDVCRYSNELAEAKEMEEEQIMKVVMDFGWSKEKAEQYYNINFKQQEQ
jgi:hypothetical protein